MRFKASMVSLGSLILAHTAVVAFRKPTIHYSVVPQTVDLKRFLLSPSGSRPHYYPQ